MTGLTMSQEGAAASAVADLENQWALASLDVSSGSSWRDAGIQGGLVTTLKESRKLLDKLEGPQLEAARAGTWPWSKWCAAAQFIHDNTAQVTIDESNWSLSGMLWSTVTATGAEVKADVNAAAEQVQAAGGGFGIGLVLGLIVAGVILWKIS